MEIRTAGSIAIPVADHVADPATDHAGGEANEQRSIQYPVFMKFFVELMIADPIDHDRREDHDAAIPGDMDAFILVQQILPVQSVDPKPTGPADLKTGNEGVREVFCHPFAQDQEENENQGDRGEHDPVKVTLTVTDSSGKP